VLMSVLMSVSCVRAVLLTVCAASWMIKTSATIYVCMYVCVAHQVSL
jgi:hypothetical protein